MTITPFKIFWLIFCTVFACLFVLWADLPPFPIGCMDWAPFTPHALVAFVIAAAVAILSLRG